MIRYGKSVQHALKRKCDKLNLAQVSKQKTQKETKANSPICTRAVSLTGTEFEIRRKRPR